MVLLFLQNQQLLLLLDLPTLLPSLLLIELQFKLFVLIQVVLWTFRVSK